MEPLALAYVALGGAVGSMLRYTVSSLLSKIDSGTFPLPIFIVNISGSFLMGVWLAVMTLMLSGRAKDLHTLVAIGVLGGYTTFSSFSFESYMLLEKGLYAQAALYMIGSVAFSVAAFFLGMWVIRAISG